MKWLPKRTGRSWREWNGKTLSSATLTRTCFGKRSRDEAFARQVRKRLWFSVTNASPLPVSADIMFFLRKEWRDPEDGIETVLLHWTTSRLEQEPNWTRAQQTTVMIPQPTPRPVLRACSLWIVPPFSRKRLLTVEPE